MNLVGDDQADRRVHGGPDKAVYAYAVEDYEWWSRELGREMAPGTFGENLTVEGIDLGALVIGTRWLVGSTELEVSQPAAARASSSGSAWATPSSSIASTRRRASVPTSASSREGDIGAGDEITVMPRADGIRVVDLGRVTRAADVEFLERVAADDAVPEGWRDWATPTAGASVIERVDDPRQHVAGIVGGGDGERRDHVGALVPQDLLHPATGLLPALGARRRAPRPRRACRRAHRCRPASRARS